MNLPINILWTGGLDSTYLLFKLSKLPIDIFPYYIIDSCRHSTRKEINTIEKITGQLAKRNDIKAVIHKIKIINKNDITSYDDIEEAWKELNKKYALGSQYSFLANFARQYNLKLAVGTLFGERSKVEQSIKNTTQLIESDTFPNLFLQINNDKKDDPAFIVFERLYFPKFMRNLEKTSEWDYLTENNATDIAQMTWFCHRPIFGMTCGHCNPCKDALNEGMEWRVSKIGCILGAIRLYTYDPIMSIWGRAKRCIKS